MSKHDKNLSEGGTAAGDPTDRLQSVTDPLSRVDGLQARSEQSRQFNAWLDRALPLLQQALGASTTGAVTSPGGKPKH